MPLLVGSNLPIPHFLSLISSEITLNQGLSSVVTFPSKITKFLPKVVSINFLSEILPFTNLSFIFDIKSKILNVTSQTLSHFSSNLILSCFNFLIESLYLFFSDRNSSSSINHLITKLVNLESSHSSFKIAVFKLFIWVVINSLSFSKSLFNIPNPHSLKESIISILLIRLIS